jgi:hypothetical protein
LEDRVEHKQDLSLELLYLTSMPVGRVKFDKKVLLHLLDVFGCLLVAASVMDSL